MHCVENELKPRKDADPEEVARKYIRKIQRICER